MGACPHPLQRQPKKALPLLNMIVVGLPAAGKTSLIASIATEREEEDLQSSTSMNKIELGIEKFVLQKRVRIVSFEVSSSAVRTWRHYYPNAHILLFVIDGQTLRSGVRKPEDLITILKEIDSMAPEHCKVILAYSKCE